MLLLVQGIFVICIFAAVLLALFGLLFVPLRANIRLRTSLAGGVATLTLAFLLFRKQARFRIHILEEPPFCMERVYLDGRIEPVGRDRARSMGGIDAVDLLHRVRFTKLRAAWRVGIAASPAGTALLAGALGALTKEAASYFFCERRMDGVIIEAHPAFHQDKCFFTLDSIAYVLPAQIIWDIWKEKREKNKHASN